MMKYRLIIYFSILLFTQPILAQQTFDYTLKTSEGDAIIHVLGHASVMFEWNQLAIYVDPYSSAHNFSSSPKADLILITHADPDHFDTSAINQLKKESTVMIYTQTCFKSSPFSGNETIMSNNDSINVLNIPIEAVPAYNIIKTRHVKGIGNGYIITFANKRVYLSGDGEVIPEMANFTSIDVAFMGYSQPYNMTTEMFTEAAQVINASVIIPYHYDNNTISELINAFKTIPSITLLTEAISTNALKRMHQNNLFYPNPVKDVLYSNAFKLNSTISIYNNIGKEIISCTLNTTGFMNVSNLPAGIYYLIVKGEKESYSGKCIVLRE